MSRTKWVPCMCSNVEVEMLRDEMQKLQDKQTFVSSWDPETMLPPFTDVIMEATDGRSVHSHVSTLVGTSEAPGSPPWTLCHQFCENAESANLFCKELEHLFFASIAIT
jgi:hypothetical protein